jgi:hypothetical protein
VAAAVVRSRFVCDCTPEASRSCAPMAFGPRRPVPALRRTLSQLTHARQTCCQVPRFLSLTLAKEGGSVLGTRSATGCRAVTVAPHQNLFETRNPPRKKTVFYVIVCFPGPANRPISRDPSLYCVCSHGRGPAQPRRRSSPHVGARWPLTHSPTSAVWAAGRTLASGQALADLGASARFAKTAGRSRNLRRGSFCLLSRRASTVSATGW